MKLILTHEVTNLGDPGDIVEVKDGYGRNYLVPQGLAIAWTRGAETQIGQIKRARQIREVRGLDHARELKSELESLTVTVKAKAAASGHLFGRVTEKEITEAIKRAGGPEVERRRLDVAVPIKSVGDHKVRIALHPEVSATLTLTVVAA